MRILLIAPMVPEPDGAGAIPVLLHAELVGLRERHDVTLIAGVGDEAGEADAAQALVRDGVDLRWADRRRPPPGLARLRRQVRLAATWGRGRWPWRTVWFADPAIQTEIDRLGAAETFDIIAVEDSAMAVYRLPPGIPRVLTEHEVQHSAQDGASSPRPRLALREVDRRRWKSYQAAAWRRFDRVQVFSERDAWAIERLAPELTARVRVNPFGIVPPAPADPAREQRDTILFTGNFTHPPNRDAAIWLAREIMPAILARRPEARLRMVGKTPSREVTALADSRIEVVANAPSMQPHLEQASVVVAPVRTGGGMRMKVLHALASGKAVVTTSRGVEGLTAGGRTPPLLIADEAEAIAAATGRLLADQRFRLDLGARARAFALEHHSPEAWAARLEAVYQEARDERRVGARG